VSPAHLNESIASMPSHLLSSPVYCAMAKAMKYRDVRAALLAQDCTPKQGKGDHEKWYCPCGGHIAVVTQSRTVSPGVVADTIKKLACLPNGWLQ